MTESKFCNLFVGITQLTEILLNNILSMEIKFFHLLFTAVNWK